MAYWWVSQNKTHSHEREGGYLWAPKRNSDGVEFHHWTNMTLVRPGDVIFSYAEQAIGAVGVATSAAYDAPQPAEFRETWDADGRRVDVTYREVAPAVPLNTFVEELVGLLPDRYSPITRTKTGVQGYLFGIPPKAGQFISERLAVVIPVEEIVEDTLKRVIPDKTTRDALVKARVGQGRWRDDLLRFWSGRCAVTGLQVEKLLRASHIKPWRDSDNQERLDVFNGLLFGASYDAAFDAGLISFDSEGKIIISDRLPAGQLDAAGIKTDAVLKSLDDKHRGYLNHHRDSVFR